METTILLKLGGWVASTAVGFIADQVQYYINDHFQFQPCVKYKLKCLEEDLQTIKAGLCEADKRRIENDELGKWLQDIKDATYDAEDVLDMFEYKIIQEKVEGTADDENNIFKRCFTCANSTVKKFIVSGDVVKKLNEVVDKFKRIAARCSDMFQLINSQPAVSQWVSEIMQLRESTSMPIKSVGRDKERAQLMQLLNQFSGDDGGSSSCRNYSRATGGVGKTTLVQDVLPVVGTSSVHVLPVVGIGGVGKTTLVQDVYNNQDVKFDLKAWVCVSDNFDVKRLTKEIIESASISKPDDFHLLENLDRIQQILQNGLKDKRFLIVLDDIWNENNTKWEQLQRVLNCGKDGSTVIVTTRNEKIAKMMGTKEAIHLEGLAKEEFWRFFRQCAFGDENPANDPGLEFVGKQIAEKLKGIPLAAKTVGAMLRLELNVQYWKEVLHNELWKKNEQEDGIMQALRLSYEYLPSYLKQCFVYCSLFPKDYQYSKTKLVRMWIAHGFILPNEHQLLEKTGEAYVNELLRRSFIHELIPNEYVIHDLLHDLAQSLSDGEIYIAENDEAPKKKVRHISICDNNLSLLCNNDKIANENLRSLVVFYCSVQKTFDVLSELKGLRVLVLCKFPVKLTLKFIQKMLHLRYLELQIDQEQENRYFTMPELVGKLYHLQVLRVGRPYIDYSCVLPNEINRLIKLRHLEAGKPKGIGKLTLLQELKFKVNQGEKGLDIGQIRDMSELTTLCLEGLETVKTKEQASQAMLNNKRHLKDLKLEWWDEEEEEEVLEGLQPHTNLEQLVIEDYGGGGTPSWWNANWASNLITLKLYDCSKWEFLPPLGHLPFLKRLRIKRMKAVKSIGSEFYASNSVGLSSKTIFPSLEELHIYDMPELKDWYKIEEEEGGGGFELFPRLKNFRIRRCPNLRGTIFQFPPSNFNQIQMKIYETAFFLKIRLLYDGTEGLIEVNCDSASKVTEWLPYTNLLTFVEHLTIERHEMGSCFPTELVEWIPHLSWWNANWESNLITLELVNCSKWEFLPPLGHLPFLKKLTIERMKAVTSIGSEFYSSNQLSSKTIFPSLEEFYISEMPELKDWYKIEEEEGGGFELFQRLKKFRIGACPKLRGSIFHFPPSNFNQISMDISDYGILNNITEGLIEVNCDSASIVREWLPSPNLLTSVECLKITEMRSCFPTELLEWIQHLTSLHSLCFHNCWELESLPSNLISLSTLRILEIKYCRNIKSLPEEGLPASIQELHVLGCYHLAKRCMNEYWEKMIAHIPTFTVDDEVVTEENRKSLQTFHGDYSYAAKEEDEEEE